jgi:hypothetical protein
MTFIAGMGNKALFWHSIWLNGQAPKNLGTFTFRPLVWTRCSNLPPPKFSNQFSPPTSTLCSEITSRRYILPSKALTGGPDTLQVGPAPLSPFPCFSSQRTLPASLPKLKRTLPGSLAAAHPSPSTTQPASSSTARSSTARPGELLDELLDGESPASSSTCPSPARGTARVSRRPSPAFKGVQARHGAGRRRARADPCRARAGPGARRRAPQPQEPFARAARQADLGLRGRSGGRISACACAPAGGFYAGGSRPPRCAPAGGSRPPRCAPADGFYAGASAGGSRPPRCAPAGSFYAGELDAGVGTAGSSQPQASSTRSERFSGELLER